MDRLEIPATRTTPEVDYDLSTGNCRLTGNSIPENAGEFYKPIIAWVTDHVPAAKGAVRFDFYLPYFNSSSVKALYHLLMTIKELSSSADGISLHWWVEEDDEFMLEAAETFEEMADLELTIEQVGPDTPPLPQQ